MPRLDDHPLPEDSPYEIIDGQRILTMANPEHAGPQLDLGGRPDVRPREQAGGAVRLGEMRRGGGLERGGARSTG